MNVAIISQQSMILVDPPMPTMFTIDTSESFSLRVEMTNMACFIDWGDGSSEEQPNSAAGTIIRTHTYGSGVFEATILMTDSSGSSKLALGSTALLSVEHIQEGLNGIAFGTGFQTSANLISVPSSIPSSITNLDLAFVAASSFNQNISSWNVSNVTSMASMFANASSFNQDLSGWCVSNIVSEPTGFATGASAWVLPKPVWGTCPSG